MPSPSDHSISCARFSAWALFGSDHCLPDGQFDSAVMIHLAENPNEREVFAARNDPVAGAMAPVPLSGARSAGSAGVTAVE
jgi:hypothetical protein